MFLFLALRMAVADLRHHKYVVKAVSGTSMPPDIANSPHANIFRAAQGVLQCCLKIDLPLGTRKVVKRIGNVKFD